MKLYIASAVLVLAAGSAFAGGHAGPSTFQNTCSNIAFAYGDDGSAMINATCLKADGKPNATSIKMPGISNNEGTLEAVDGEASFQMSCGSIHLETSIDGVMLKASCRTSAGTFNAASISVDGINNMDGVLSN